ncbi:hypothetical protein QWZ08_25030 [Ferruginibacter paludis]|uniref:hypothetical protein n=1 Tax=Ferruginibacter paludis TaxID=1310417 RepID=UPI0025B3F34C|nr:hypothetical protein [Ferruginibacter paludis]MDN3658932.1 hypothetical protein [Ferruginibacter paludis]
MKSRKKIIKQNNKSIEIFFSTYRNETEKEMTGFLFDLQGLYLKQPGVNISDELKEKVAMQFTMLYDLVTGISPIPAKE